MPCPLAAPQTLLPRLSTGRAADQPSLSSHPRPRPSFSSVLTLPEPLCCLHTLVLHLFLGGLERWPSEGHESGTGRGTPVPPGLRGAPGGQGHSRSSGWGCPEGPRLRGGGGCGRTYPPSLEGPSPTATSARPPSGCQASVLLPPPRPQVGSSTDPGDTAPCTIKAAFEVASPVQCLCSLTPYSGWWARTALPPARPLGATPTDVGAPGPLSSTHPPCSPGLRTPLPGKTLGISVDRKRPVPGRGPACHPRLRCWAPAALHLSLRAQ